jgi:hypothetical protein
MPTLCPKTPLRITAHLGTTAFLGPAQGSNTAFSRQGLVDTLMGFPVRANSSVIWTAACCSNWNPTTPIMFLNLRGDGTQQQRQGVLKLSTPGKYSHLFVLATSVGGSIYENLLLKFDDGTVSSAINILARDWFAGTNEYTGDFPRRPAITRLGANDVAGSDFSYVSGASYGYELHQTDIDLASLGLDAKVLTEMTFSLPSSTPLTAVILAVSGEPNLKGQPVDLGKDLIAYYPFNNNLKDESGHSLDGSPVGLCDFATDRFGTPLSALKLQASNPGAVLVNSSLFPKGNSARTVSAWIKPDFGNMTASPGGEKSGAIVSFGPVSEATYGLWADAKLTDGTNFNSRVVVSYNGPYTVTHPQPADTNWHHLALVFDGAFVSQFLDGELLTYTQLPVNTPGDELLIGRLTGGYRQYAGAIDDVKIFNRALTAAEISALRNQPVYPFFESIGLFSGVVVKGVAGKTYEIQYTTNLDAAPIWTAITNVTLTTYRQLWVDTTVEARSQPKRFYRVLAQ